MRNTLTSFSKTARYSDYRYIINYILIGTTVMTFLGCTVKKTYSTTSITENESKAIDSVRLFFGEKIEYEKREESSNGINNKFFQLVLTPTSTLQKLATDTRPITNYACIFYKNLSPVERSNYNEITLKVMRVSGDTTMSVSYSFRCSMLDTIIQSMSKLDAAIKSIREFNENEFLSQCEPALIHQMTANSILKYISDSTNGDLVSFTPLGKAITDSDKAVVYSGIQTRNKNGLQNAKNFTIKVKLNTARQYIMAFGDILLDF